MFLSMDEAAKQNADAKAAKQKTIEDKMAAMTPEELEENRRSFAQFQALEKKREELQALMKEAEQENERTLEEKKRLLKEKAGRDGEVDRERDSLLAEAKELKEQLLAIEDGKVPEHMMERMTQIQQRLSAMGLAAGQKAMAEKKAVEPPGALRHLFDRLLPIFALGGVFSVLGLIMYKLQAGDPVSKKGKKKQR